MNYLKHYDLLIKKAQNRPIPDGYVEKHHILPKSMGGSDEKENLVYLTAREHFIAHFLLAKHYGENQWYPVMMFKQGLNAHRNGTKINSYLYEASKKNHKKIHSEFMKEYSNRPENIKRSKKSSFKVKKEKRLQQIEKLKERYKNPEERKKISEKTKKAMQNPEIRKKISEKAKERLKCDEWECKVHNARKVKCLETYQIYNSLQLAAKWLRSIGHVKAGHACIRDTIIGKQKHSYGYHWEYVD